ncbi:excinuclease ABC subunit C, partial [bacterium]|nr:excinuclease ABC subunit C [bacterium]
YIINFYEKNLKPKEILVPEEIDSDLLSEYLKLKVTTPKRGDLKKLLDLAKENAIIALKEEIEKEKRDDDLKRKALKELSNLLGKDISVMESFDNSHLFGTYYVGAMVVYKDFVPLKNKWRKYKIKSDVKDDLGAMREVIYRRYFKAIMENDYLPDLIVMDGGETQVSVAKEVLASLNLSIKIIGLKKDNHHKTSIIIDDDNNTLNISKDSPLFIYLAKIQEEVHRFAITYHKTLRSQGLFSSYLDMVDGIGEVRKKELLKKYGSLKKIKEASVEELKEILPTDVAENLYNLLRKEE